MGASLSHLSLAHSPALFTSSTMAFFERNKAPARRHTQSPKALSEWRSLPAKPVQRSSDDATSRGEQKWYAHRLRAKHEQRVFYSIVYIVVYYDIVVPPGMWQQNTLGMTHNLFVFSIHKDPLRHGRRQSCRFPYTSWALCAPGQAPARLAESDGTRSLLSTLNTWTRSASV